MKFQARRGRRQVLGRSCVVVGAWTWNRNRSKGGEAARHTWPGLGTEGDAAEKKAVWCAR